jgi:hypothetical protein
MVNVHMVNRNGPYAGPMLLMMDVCLVFFVFSIFSKRSF